MAETGPGSVLLVGSCEPFSGKSALVLGLARHLMTKGAQIRFGKPLATSDEAERQAAGSESDRSSATGAWPNGRPQTPRLGCPNPRGGAGARC
jgi:cobyric acid synthase